MEGKRTVLCMDDDADNCELMEIFFEQSGCEATSCPTAEDCRGSSANSKTGQQ